MEELLGLRGGEALEREKMLSREINHRVKNNMSVISSLLSLQSSVSQNEETVAVLKDCQDRVNTMAMVSFLSSLRNSIPVKSN